MQSARLLGDDIVQLVDHGEMKQRLKTAITEGGPNSGLLLQGENIFETPVIAGEIPEISSDVTMITSLESELEALECLIRDIRHTRGMSQSHARTMHRLIPSMESQFPVGYFTSEPTATLYMSSLESISKKMWGLIAAIVAGIIAAIYGFVRWITGRRSGGSAGGGTSSGSSNWWSGQDKVASNPQELKKDIDKATESARQEDQAHQNTAKVLDKVEAVLEKTNAEVEVVVPPSVVEAAKKDQEQPDTKPPETHEDGKPKFRTNEAGKYILQESLVAVGRDRNGYLIYEKPLNAIPDLNNLDKSQLSLHLSFNLLIKEQAKKNFGERFLKQRNPVMLDVFNKGRYTEMVLATISDFTSFLTAFQQKAELLRQIVVSSKESYNLAKEGFIRKNIEQLKTPITIRINRENLSFADAGHYLASERREVMNQEVKDTDIVLDTAFAIMRNIYRDSRFRAGMQTVNNALISIMEVQYTLLELQNAVKSMSYDGMSKEGPHPDMAPLYREALSAVTKDLNGLMALYAEIRIFTEQLDYLAISTLDMVRESIRALTGFMRFSKYKIPREMEQVEREIENSYREMLKNYENSTIISAAVKALRDNENNRRSGML